MHNQDRHEILSKFELLTLVYFLLSYKIATFSDGKLYYNFRHIKIKRE